MWVGGQNHAQSLGVPRNSLSPHKKRSLLFYSTPQKNPLVWVTPAKARGFQSTFLGSATLRLVFSQGKNPCHPSYLDIHVFSPRENTLADVCGTLVSRLTTALSLRAHYQGAKCPDPSGGAKSNEQQRQGMSPTIQASPSATRYFHAGSASLPDGKSKRKFWF